MKYTAKSGNYIATGATANKAKARLAEAIRRDCDTAAMTDCYGDPIIDERRLRAARRGYAARLIERATVSITVADLSGWDEDQYFAGFGHRRMAMATWGQWTIQSSTDAEGATVLSACLTRDLRSAAAKSIRAGGGVRGLCMDHVDPSAVRILSPSDNLLRL